MVLFDLANSIARLARYNELYIGVCLDIYIEAGDYYYDVIMMQCDYYYV